MNKKEYLEELRKELKLNNVEDIDDVISEYEEHFAFKLEEGLTEEEISKKLKPPKELAKEFTSKPVPINKFEKNVKIAGLTFLTIPLGMIYALILASVAVLGCFGVVSAVTGFCLITTINIAGIIPFIPYFPALVLGISFFSLSVLSAIGTFYIFMYVKQWGKVYLRWCKNVANGNYYPSISKHPKLSKKLSYRLKLVAIISLVCFVVTFAVGYFSMCIATSNMEPWHVWKWFE